jgi:membrane-anchored protein YejM (alkaline phosphatase superfamily)
MINAHQLVGTHNVLFITLDTLRYDVACQCLIKRQTPNIAALLPTKQWEERHTPGNFTYSAHHAFFAGFLPTPIKPGPHPRMFAVRFPGSETTTDHTYVFDTPDIVTGLAQIGYHTICIGGVGFFNKQSPLGSALPNLFAESHWNPSLGVTDPHSTENQVKLAIDCIRRLNRTKRFFLFINVSAIHQPNCIFVPGAERDTPETHAAALVYVDRCLPPLLVTLQQHGPTLVIICSDHGTAYGEDGFTGHRINHPVVLTVPYAEFILPGIVTR